MTTKINKYSHIAKNIKQMRFFEETITLFREGDLSVTFHDLLTE